MNGPAHFQHAEQLLDWASEDPEPYGEMVRYRVAAAQVHAILALVAVTANLRTEGVDGADSLADFDPEWAKAVNG